MEIEEMHRAATRAWHFQWANLGVVVLVLIVAFVEEGRMGVGSRFLAGLNFWTPLVFIAFMAERTWFGWRQLQRIRSLTAPLTVIEFRRATARERLHHSVWATVLVAYTVGVSIWTLHDYTLLLPSTRLCLWVSVAVAIGGLLRSWRKFRATS